MLCYADRALFHRHFLFGTMVPSPSVSAEAEVDKESGTCPSGADKPPRKATFIATLRCKTVSEQVCHRLADALRSIGLRARLTHLKGKAVTASSRLFRSLRLLHNRQLAVLIYPPPPPGAINARETPYQCDRQCFESAYINIIPSGLCNKSARAPLVSASHTIRIMLSTLRQ